MAQLEKEGDAAYIRSLGPSLALPVAPSGGRHTYVAVKPWDSSRMNMTSFRRLFWSL